MSADAAGIRDTTDDIYYSSNKSEFYYQQLKGKGKVASKPIFDDSKTKKAADKQRLYVAEC
ncbi:hypothetical protein NBRC116595_28650 [Aliiglaciecola sp. NS0011-25]